MAELPQSEALRIIATETLQVSGDVHRLVTFLNQALKQRGLIFGLTRSDEEYTLAIYEARPHSDVKE